MYGIIRSCTFTFFGGEATSLYAKPPNHLSGCVFSTPSVTWLHQT